MKIQIRQGVFETNSSSEHSLSVVKLSDFRDWKDGKSYAKRSQKYSECKETWGNFWAEQHYWDFAILSPEEAEKKNKEIFKENLIHEKQSIDAYIEKYGKVDEWVKYHQERLESKSFEKVKLIDKLYDGMWITYAEYKVALQQDDCYSPFEHINETQDVAVFGKYFHS